MGDEITKRLVNFWGRSFFIEPLVIISFIVCFIIGIFYHHKNKERLFFTAYFFSGVILFVPSTIIILFKILTGNRLTIYQEVSNTFFESTEFLAFYFFFKKCLQNNKYQKYLKMSVYFLFTIIVIFFIGLTSPNYRAEEIRGHSLFINVIEFFFLFIMCLAYFRELFTDAPTKNLLKRPSFLIVTSTFFYAILMIPFFLVAKDIFLSEIAIYNTLFSCHYILLMILLFSISKAFLCKIPITM
jgi:hypothetical protein